MKEVERKRKNNLLLLNRKDTEEKKAFPEKREVNIRRRNPFAKRSLEKRDVTSCEKGGSMGQKGASCLPTSLSGGGKSSK